MYTTSNLKPELQLTALKYRQAFVDAANAALQKGRSQSDAEFVGMAAVARLESIDAKNAAVAIQKDVTNREPPSHLAAVLRARELRKAEAKPETLPMGPGVQITGVRFTPQGKLVVLFDDGTEKVSDNEVPVESIINQYVTVQAPSGPPVGEGGVSEFDDINELDRVMSYVDGNLVRIDYQSGNYKTFTYTAGNLTQVDYVKGSVTYRKTMTYDGLGNLTSVVYTTI